MSVAGCGLHVCARMVKVRCENCGMSRYVLNPVIGLNGKFGGMVAAQLASACMCSVSCVAGLLCRTAHAHTHAHMHTSPRVHSQPCMRAGAHQQLMQRCADGVDVMYLRVTIFFLDSSEHADGGHRGARRSKG